MSENIGQQTLVVHHKPWSASFDVYIKARDITRQKVYFVPGDKLEYQEAEMAQEPYPPTISIPDYEIQELFDRLWNIGLRPSKMADNAGEVKAMKEHIGDLRKMNSWFMEKNND